MRNSALTRKKHTLYESTSSLRVLFIVLGCISCIIQRRFQFSEREDLPQLRIIEQCEHLSVRKYPKEIPAPHVSKELGISLQIHNFRILQDTMKPGVIQHLSENARISD